MKTFGAACLLTCMLLFCGCGGDDKDEQSRNTVDQRPAVGGDSSTTRSGEYVSTTPPRDARENTDRRTERRTPDGSGERERDLKADERSTAPDSDREINEREELDMDRGAANMKSRAKRPDRRDAQPREPREPAPPLVAAFPDTPGTVGLEDGDLIPEITGEDVEGVAFKLSDYKGKVIMLDFWGDW